MWQLIDRPNPLNESKYTKEELEEFVAARHKIEDAAESLDIQLEIEEKAATDALCKAMGIVDQ